MTTFQIKLIAILTMTLDHIGLYFFPDIFVLRVIGRLSFPLFAFLIANGAIHTRNWKAYLFRIFLFACISQVPFFLLNRQFGLSSEGLNIFVTLFLGLLTIELVKKSKNTFLSIAIIALLSSFAGMIKADYGSLGVLSIVSFYLCFKNKWDMIVQQGVISLLPFLNLIFPGTRYYNGLPVPLVQLFQPVGLLSFIFILKYNNKEGPRAKHFFYWYYPLHLFVIFLIKLTI